MAGNRYKFEIPKHHKSIIKVIGVGGGGSNAVNHMFNQGIKDVEFVVCNTDSQALKGSPVPNKLQIGINLTEGLGAGANPDMGKDAAIESKEEIRDLLSNDTKMIFITAGMGGGTGTGAAPIIAKVANELGILTVGIVTLPFSFEGKKKMAQAERGIAALKESCDTVLVISNDKLGEVYGNLPISQAFAEADNVLKTAAKGIAEIITVPGYVNVDFEDVKTVMKGSGAAVMGSAETEGENRAGRAAEEAISSPLLNNVNVHGAQKILLSIISGEEAELQMDELSEITDHIQEKVGDEAEMIFGHGIDPNLGKSMRVTVIATGFDPDNHSARYDDEKKIFDLESSKQITLFQEDAPDSLKQQAYVKQQTQKEESLQTSSHVSDDTPDLFSNLEKDYDIVEIPPSEKETADTLEMSADMQSKKILLEKQAKERIQRLSGLRNDSLDADMKEKLDVPAYLRKNVRLDDTPHSSESNISRYNLNDDNEISGNNKFLHDNVD